MKSERPPDWFGTQPTVKLTLLDTGYCTASEHVVIAGGERRTINCHALVGLLHHPLHGYFLWDTGYAPRMFDATRQLPYRMYRWMTPLHIRADQTVVAQLEQHGIRADQIRHVIVSHFHADHVAGLLDFPNTRLISHHCAYADFIAHRGFGAVRRGYLPALVPPDFLRGAQLLPTFTGPPLGGLGETFDLWGDGTVRLVELPGHARGQIGMLAHTDEGRVFLVADACWLRRSIDEGRPPSRLGNMIADDPQAVRKMLAGLGRFVAANPDVRIVPTHCPDTYAEWFGYPA